MEESFQAINESGHNPNGTIKRRLNRSNSDPIIYPLKRTNMTSSGTPELDKSYNLEGNIYYDELMSFSIDGSNKAIPRNFSFGSANITMMSKSNSSPNLTSLINESNVKNSTTLRSDVDVRRKSNGNGVKPRSMVGRVSSRQALYDSIAGGGVSVSLNTSTLDCESLDLFVSSNARSIMVRQNGIDEPQQSSLSDGRRPPLTKEHSGTKWADDPSLLMTFFRQESGNSFKSGNSGDMKTDVADCSPPPKHPGTQQSRQQDSSSVSDPSSSFSSLKCAMPSSQQASNTSNTSSSSSDTILQTMAQQIHPVRMSDTKGGDALFSSENGIATESFGFSADFHPSAPRSSGHQNDAAAAAAAAAAVLAAHRPKTKKSLSKFKNMTRESSLELVSTGHMQQPLSPTSTNSSGKAKAVAALGEAASLDLFELDLLEFKGLDGMSVELNAVDMETVFAAAPKSRPKGHSKENSISSLMSDAKSSSVGSTIVSWVDDVVDGAGFSALDEMLDAMIECGGGGSEGGLPSGTGRKKKKKSGSRSNNSSGSNWTEETERSARSNRTTSTNKSGTKRFVNKQPQMNRRSINNHYKDPHFQPAASLDEARSELLALTETNLRRLSSASHTSNSSSERFIAAQPQYQLHGATVNNSRSNQPAQSTPFAQMDFSFPTEFAPNQQQYRNLHHGDGTSSHNSSGGQSPALLQHNSGSSSRPDSGNFNLPEMQTMHITSHSNYSSGNSDEFHAHMRHQQPQQLYLQQQQLQLQMQYQQYQYINQSQQPQQYATQSMSSDSSSTVMYQQQQQYQFPTQFPPQLQHQMQMQQSVGTSALYASNLSISTLQQMQGGGSNSFGQYRDQNSSGSAANTPTSLTYSVTPHSQVGTPVLSAHKGAAHGDAASVSSGNIVVIKREDGSFVKKEGGGRSKSKSSVASSVSANRGNYRCGRCGQPKVNHVCEFVDLSMVSSAAQAESPIVLSCSNGVLQPLPGDRLLAVNSSRTTIQDTDRTRSSSGEYCMPALSDWAAAASSSTDAQSRGNRFEDGHPLFLTPSTDDLLMDIMALDDPVPSGGGTATAAGTSMWRNRVSSHSGAAMEVSSTSVLAAASFDSRHTGAGENAVHSEFNFCSSGGVDSSSATPGTTAH